MTDNLTNSETSKLYLDSIKNLRKIEEYLTKQSNQQAAEILRSQIIRLEVFANTYLNDTTDLEIDKFKHDPLKQVLYRLWKQYYPMYGNPSATDRQAVEFLFFDIIYQVYPTATEVFFEECIRNFKESTQKWVVDNQTLGVFCKHFRKLVNGPLLVAPKPDYTTVRSDGY